jgi:hypothetical protein
MKNFINKENNFSLHSSENYKKELDCELSHVTESLSKLFIDYFKYIIEHIKIKRPNFSKFIILRGLDTIINVFHHLLLYTKNLDLTYFHCQKAFYFYVEFVSQISDDEKIFLQLTSRDATTYVYKKTIYDISLEFRKLNENISDYTKLKLNIINNCINLYKTLLSYIINNDLNNEESINKINDIYKKLNKLDDKIVIEKLHNVIEKFYYYINDMEKFLKVINIIIKKIQKNPDILDNIFNKFSSDDLLNKLNEPVDKMMNWFIQ